VRYYASTAVGVLSVFENDHPLVAVVTTIDPELGISQALCKLRREQDAPIPFRKSTWARRCARIVLESWIYRVRLTMNESARTREFRLGRLVGLDVSATPSALVGTLGLWVVLSALGYWVIHLPLGNAILGGLAATLLFHAADMWHQLGHSFVARSTGHPMTGVRFGFLGILSTGIFPADEGELPPAVHIRRALGGPLGSLIMSIVAAIIFLLINTSRSGGTVWWLALFFLLVNFVVFTLEVFVPVGFNDASTILHWSRARQK
jgi:hypothetical protein